MSRQINRGRMEIGQGAAGADDLDATNAAFRAKNEDSNGRQAPTNNSKSVIEQLYEYFSNTPGCAGGGLGLGSFGGLWGASEPAPTGPQVFENSVEAPETGGLYSWKIDLCNHNLEDATNGQRIALFVELARQMESGVRFDDGGLTRCVEFAKAQPTGVAVDQILSTRPFGMLRMIRQLETRDVLDVLYEATHDECLQEGNPNRRAVYAVLVGGASSRALCVVCRPKGEALEILLIDVVKFAGRGAAVMSFNSVDAVIEYCQKYFEHLSANVDDKDKLKTKYKALVLSAAVGYADESGAERKLAEASVETKGKDAGAQFNSSGKSSMANRVVQEVFGK